MKQIKKYLVDNNIQHEIEVSKIWKEETIVILIEKGNVWVNGYGNEMKWDRVIAIHQNRYKKYVVTEKVGYSRTKEHIKTGKQKEVTNLLATLDYVK
ncbi:hypothetical protein [Bacillus thuringiensis]|uniref:hypothetical protein n=1 Tax=Bacillus thuringiensis TaxID=1428 RepID=UPI000BFE342C|nr:hypothetical protein [Bacillus thuringiensis]PGT90031.1 hypothetical protein COD17_09790 [Bacillus thuringiensis]